jgi:hypothetical protein
MTRHALTGAALLAVVLAAPAAAQEVISEPGYCAQFYPNANCENKGPGNPYTDPNFHRNDGAIPDARALTIQPRRPPHHHHRKRLGYSVFKRSVFRFA